MFGISMWEIILILLVLFVLVGPQKLPELAKSLGKTLGSIRKSVDEVKKEVDLGDSLDLLKEARDFNVYDLLEDDQGKKMSVPFPSGPESKEPVKAGRQLIRPGNQSMEELDDMHDHGAPSPLNPSAGDAESGSTAAAKSTEKPFEPVAVSDRPLSSPVRYDPDLGLPFPSGVVKKSHSTEQPADQPGSTHRRMVKPGRSG